MESLGQIKLAVLMGQLSPLGELFKARGIGERIDQREGAGATASVDRHIDGGRSMPVAVQEIGSGMDQQGQRLDGAGMARPRCGGSIPMLIARAGIGSQCQGLPGGHGVAIARRDEQRFVRFRGFDGDDGDEVYSPWEL